MKLKTLIYLDHTGKVEFPDFLSTVAKRDVEIDHEEELYYAFKNLQKKDQENQDVMVLSTLKHMLTTGKEAFSEKDWNEMSKILPSKDDKVKIEDIINIIVGSMNMSKIK